MHDHGRSQQYAYDCAGICRCDDRLGPYGGTYYSVLTGVYAIYGDHGVGINNSGDALPCTPEAGESNGRTLGAIFHRDSDHGSAYYRRTPDHIGWIARKPTSR